MRLLCLNLLLGLVFIEHVIAIVYVTDLPAFQALAPCAQYAVSYEVQKLTYSECQEAVTALESCACTQDQNSAAVSSSISSQILYTCGKTASEDVASASVVFSAYCNQGGPVATVPPGPHAVSAYITDLTAYSQLAPCAAYGVSYVIMGMTHSNCPTGNPSALASCVCSKNQNSLAASESLGSQVKYTCGSTHTEDITSAQAVLAGYCGLANGTTSFPTPSPLPGSVSYYITALPNYHTLASCAQEALAYPIQAQTYSDCPSNPQALVSCLCVKDSNSAMMTSLIINSASVYCGSTASANMASALSVFDFYCSVGKGLATLQVTLPSVTTTPFGSGSNSRPTGSGTNPFGGFASSTSIIVDGGGGSPTGAQNPLGSNSNTVPIAAIAGAAAGGLVFVIFMLLVGWRYRRRRLVNKPPPPQMTQPPPRPGPGGPDWTKAELANTQATAVPPKSKLLRKPVSDVVSPVSPVATPNPLSRPAEMMAPPAPFRAEVPSGPNAQELHHDIPQHEMPGGPNVQELHHDVPQHEVQGSNHFPVEMSANLNGPFEMDGDRRWH